MWTANRRTTLPNLPCLTLAALADSPLHADDGEATGSLANVLTGGRFGRGLRRRPSLPGRDQGDAVDRVGMLTEQTGGEP